MPSQFDKIWCLQYDQDSYYRPLDQVNFAKYLTSILSCQYFSQFQKIIANQITDPSQWNQRCWQIIQFFNYLNNAFEFNKFQENVSFVSDKKLRKLFGNFRMWIDLERLYLFSFLKLDKMQFQEDRIFFTIYRTLIFFYDFLKDSHREFFSQKYLIEIARQIKKYMKNLSQYSPQYFNPFLQIIEQIIPKFLNQNQLVPKKLLEQIKKTAFLKLMTEYDVMPEIQERLTTSLNYRQKQGQFNKVKNITKSNIVRNHGEKIRSIYDPRFRIIQNFRKKAEAQKTEIDEENLLSHLEEYNKKMREKPTNQTPYQTIKKVGHNPYDNNNYLIYGESLGIDMDKKINLQKQDDQNHSISSHSQFQYKYSPEYLQKSQIKGISSSKVQKSDLNLDIVYENFGEKMGIKKQGKLSQTKWEKYAGVPESEKAKTVNLAALSTIQSANASKDLQKNVLFKNQADLQQQESDKRNKKAKQISQKGIQSQILFYNQQRAQNLYKIQQRFGNEIVINIKHKCTVDKTKFDSMRKIAQYNAVINKIRKWIYQENIPLFYPRGISQIKQFPIDPKVTTRYRKKAFQTMFQQ